MRRLVSRIRKQERPTCRLLDRTKTQLLESTISCCGNLYQIRAGGSRQIRQDWQWPIRQTHRVGTGTLMCLIIRWRWSTRLAMMDATQWVMLLAEVLLWVGGQSEVQGS